MDLARLAYAKVSICSVSTFCLWPAIASQHRAYFPLHSVIAGKKALDLGPRFVWIQNASVIMHFSMYKFQDLIEWLRFELK